MKGAVNLCHFRNPWLRNPCLRTAKGASGKGPRQKTSKIVKNCPKYLRHFSTFFAQGKKRQKSSKKVKNIFDTFRQFSRGTSFPAFRPLLGGSDPCLLEIAVFGIPDFGILGFQISVSGRVQVWGLPSESLPSESLFSEFPPSESLLSEFPPSEFRSNSGTP